MKFDSPDSTPPTMKRIDWPLSAQTCAGVGEPSLQSASCWQREPAQFVPWQLARQREIGPMHVPVGEPTPQSVSLWQALPTQSTPPFAVQPGAQCWLSVAKPTPLTSFKSW